MVGRQEQAEEMKNVENRERILTMFYFSGDIEMVVVLTLNVA